MHAILSASSSHRWLNCTPSARLEQDYPNTTSKASEEGTLAHKLLEEKLKGTFQKENYINNNFYNEVMEEYINHVIKVFELQNENFILNQNLFLEQLVNYDLKGKIPEGFGTVDILRFKEDVLEIFDLKYGKHPVITKNNTQLQLYALGGIKFCYDRGIIINTVKMTIMQPRYGNLYSEPFVLTTSELISWLNEISPKAIDSFAGLGELKTGSHCKFCKHKNNCTEYQNKNIKI